MRGPKAISISWGLEPWRIITELRQFAANQFHLLFEDVLTCVLAQIEERVEHIAVEARVFARALHFDEVLGVLHHDVHVDIGSGVFYIAQVAERLAIDDTHGNGGDAVLQDLLSDAQTFLDFLEREGEGDKTADDACGTGAAVSFDDVAIDDDCVLAEGGEIGGTAEGTAHQALDFLRAATGSLAFAFHALARALREQGVFGGNPARAAAGEPVGDFREEGGVADDAGASHLNEHGTVGTGDEAGGHLEVAVFVKFAVGTFVHSGYEVAAL